MRLTQWLRRRRAGYRTKLERTLDAWEADEARRRAGLAAIRERCREDPPRPVAWPRPAYAPYKCGCIQFRYGEPRWERCVAHAVAAEIESWRT